MPRLEQWCVHGFVELGYLCQAVCTLLYVLLQGLDVSRCVAEAALDACELVRAAQERAFEECGRSMVASDIVRHLPGAVRSCWDE